MTRSSVTGGDVVEGCHSCRESRADDLPPRCRILWTAYWRAAHSFDTSLPGWLVLVPHRHVTSMAELTPEEAAELGPLLTRLTAALAAELGCVKTYVMLFAESEGFAHVHFHVVPRMPDQPEELRGPRIFAALARPVAERVGEDEADRIALALSARLGS